MVLAEVGHFDCKVRSWPKLEVKRTAFSAWLSSPLRHRADINASSRGVSLAGPAALICYVLINYRYTIAITQHIP